MCSISTSFKVMRERGVKSYVASLFSLSLYVPKRVGTYSYLPP